MEDLTQTSKRLSKGNTISLLWIRRPRFKKRATLSINSAGWGGFAVISSLIIATLYSSSVQAVTSLDKRVALYPLQCDETFSCPTTLLPRVGFWVEVFSRWDTNTAIFHDKESPHRVYSTLQRKQGCRKSRKGDSVDKERRRLKKILNSTAVRLEQGKSLSDAQKRIQANFVGESAREIRAAANRVRCQSGNQDRMREALTQFQLYRPTILDALESQNLTPELQYLPFVESAFNPEALSHVGAAGLWQIMPATGRNLGLKVNNVVDERYDPKSATYAAARYFRNSVDSLSETAFENGFPVVAKELNPFVITSYNYGVRGMQRAIKQVGLDYERLLVEYKSPSFQTAVKNFYASFLAARHVAKNSEKFFGIIKADQSARIHSFNTTTLSRATSAKRVSSELGIDIDALDKLNPALKKVVWKHKALIPKAYQLKLPYREVGWDAPLAAMNALAAEIERPGFQWHRVRRGQTACGIADKYGASCSALRKLNKLDRKATIYIGKRLKVPTKTGGISVAKGGSSSNASGSISSVSYVDNGDAIGKHSAQRYKVRRGDTSCNIASRFSMKCGEFLALNGLGRSSIIRIGQQVTVSGSNKWHTVAKGQSACAIAESYRVRCSALLDANRLTRKSTIGVGQRLRVPTRW
ncbi:MAG: membrane-bound lytic murein transglycosylase D [Cryomorphaceae bacterium]|jgi:membrane-bound lytic murein transglycosylase D